MSIDIKPHNQEKYEKLTEMGLSEDKSKSTIDEKVVRLEAFCINNPRLWLVSSNTDTDIEKIYLADIDEQERKNIIEQLNLARKDYEYIYHRKIDGKLPDEYSERLRKAGVGRSFGYKDEIEDLARQYEKKIRSHSNYSEDEIKDKVAYIKRFLYKKDMKFGGLDKCRQAFVEALINHDSEQMGEIMSQGDAERGFFITQFDVNSPDFINQTGMGDLISIVLGDDPSSFKHYGLQEMMVFNSKAIKEVLETLTDMERDVLNQRYGLTNGITTKRVDVAKNLDSTVERIRNIEAKALKKLKHPSRRKIIMKIGIDSDREEQFTRKYFEHHDIFSFSDSDGLDDKIKSELLEIYNEGINEKEIQEDASKKRFASEVEEDSYSRTIDSLNLSTRSFHCLKYAGIKTVEDLLALSEEEIRNIRNIGKKSLDEIIEKIATIKNNMKEKADVDTIQQVAGDSVYTLQTPDEIIEQQIAAEYAEKKKCNLDIQSTTSEVPGNNEVSGESNVEEQKEVTEDLSHLSLEELENLISSNKVTIENNEKIIKQALIDKITRQQARIAEQEKEISELRRERNGHEQ